MGVGQQQAAAELPECPRKGVVHQGHRRQQDCSDHAAGEDKSAWISCSLCLTASNMGKLLCEVMFKYSHDLSNLTESSKKPIFAKTIKSGISQFVWFKYQPGIRSSRQTISNINNVNCGGLFMILWTRTPLYFLCTPHVSAIPDIVAHSSLHASVKI